MPRPFGTLAFVMTALVVVVFSGGYHLSNRIASPYDLVKTNAFLVHRGDVRLDAVEGFDFEALRRNWGDPVQKAEEGRLRYRRLRNTMSDLDA